MSDLIYTFLISMVPVIELRGAIPAGIALGLTPIQAFIVSVIGNMIPVPFILLFITAIFKWIRQHLPKLDSLITKIENKAKLKSEKVLKYQVWGLFLFVAIPLPGTGAWTGSLIASILDMDFKKAFFSVLLGVLSAGIIVTLISAGVFSMF